MKTREFVYLVGLDKRKSQSFSYSSIRIEGTIQRTELTSRFPAPKKMEEGE